MTIHFTPQEISKIKILRENKYTLREISEELFCSPTTIAKVLRNERKKTIPPTPKPSKYIIVAYYLVEV